MLTSCLRLGLREAALKPARCTDPTPASHFACEFPPGAITSRDACQLCACGGLAVSAMGIITSAASSARRVANDLARHRSQCSARLPGL
jgi:hypothetical protein